MNSFISECHRYLKSNNKSCVIDLLVRFCSFFLKNVLKIDFFFKFEIERNNSILFKSFISIWFETI